MIDNYAIWDKGFTYKLSIILVKKFVNISEKASITLFPIPKTPNVGAESPAFLWVLF